MDYVILKAIHVSAVSLSFAGFVARGVGVLSHGAWVRHRLARRLPHLIDTLLLLSALGMLWVLHLAPWALPWLRAKLIGLVLYIALGVVALWPARRGASARIAPVNALAWVGALLVFGYIVSVAVTKSPRGPLQLL